jgi:hypothetical protein
MDIKVYDLMKYIRTSVVEGKIPNPNDDPSTVVKKLVEEEVPGDYKADQIPNPGQTVAVGDDSHKQYQETLKSEFGIDIDSYTPQLEGAEARKPCDYPLEELIQGIKVEQEHTKDNTIAMEIAMDHLAERADYYTVLLAEVEPKTEDKPVENVPAEKNVGMTQKQDEEDFMVTEAKLNERTNEEVIQMFLADRFTKDKMQSWGTANLKIEKDEYSGQWGLKNYMTWIVYRAADGKVYLNSHKYSVTTSKIQNYIRRIAQELGVQLTEVEDDNLTKVMDADYDKSAPKVKEGRIPDSSDNAEAVIQKIKDSDLRSGLEYVGQSGKVEDVPESGNYIGVRMNSDHRLRYFFPEDIMGGADGQSEPMNQEKEEFEATHADMGQRREIEDQAGVNSTMEAKEQIPGKSQLKAHKDNLRKENVSRKELNHVLAATRGEVPEMNKEEAFGLLKSKFGYAEDEIDRMKRGVYEAKVNEVLDYRIKESDRKVIAAFIDGATNGSGKSLDIEGDKLSSGFIKDLATRTADGKIKVGQASGLVSQTWVNAIRKMAKAAGVLVESFEDEHGIEEFEGEEEETQPDEHEDIFWQDYGTLGSDGGFFYAGKEIAKNDAELKVWMEKNKYWPNVWFVSDHGNISPYSLSESRKKLNESVQISAEELLAKVKAPENQRMYKLVMDRLNSYKQSNELSRERAVSMLTNLVQPIAHLLYVDKMEQVTEGGLPYDAVVTQVATMLADEIMGGVREAKETFVPTETKEEAVKRDKEEKERMAKLLKKQGPRSDANSREDVLLGEGLDVSQVKVGDTVIFGRNPHQEGDPLGLEGTTGKIISVDFASGEAKVSCSEYPDGILFELEYLEPMGDRFVNSRDAFYAGVREAKEDKKDEKVKEEIPSAGDQPTGKDKPEEAKKDLAKSLELQPQDKKVAELIKKDLEPSKEVKEQEKKEEKEEKKEDQREDLEEGTAPGKFEQEPTYVEHFWGQGLEGMSDADQNGYYMFTVEHQDAEQFPELANEVGKTLILWEDENGFVYSELTEQSIEQLMADLGSGAEDRESFDEMVEACGKMTEKGKKWEAIRGNMTKKQQSKMAKKAAKTRKEKK